jgi:hypothetical protein
MAETEILGFAFNYALNLPSEALAGNVFAVSVLLILFYGMVIVINKLTDIIILLLKKVILLVIVSLAFYQFLQIFSEKMTGNGLTADILIFGVAGSVIGLLAFLIAVRGAFSSLRKVRGRGRVPEPVEGPRRETKKPYRGGIASIKSLREDKRLGVVIAYLIVAEFGVISSKTVAAPNATVGMLFFSTFILAALFFIQQSYRDYRTGIRHFLVAFVIGGVLSIILGYFWGNQPLDELLSEAYFVSDSLVAFVTGIAVSLFMGSKG